MDLNFFAIYQDNYAQDFAEIRNFAILSRYVTIYAYNKGLCLLMEENIDKDNEKIEPHTVYTWPRYHVIWETEK